MHGGYSAAPTRCVTVRCKRKSLPIDRTPQVTPWLFQFRKKGFYKGLGLVYRVVFTFGGPPYAKAVLNTSAVMTEENEYAGTQR
jgi:hypothetical protein